MEKYYFTALDAKGRLHSGTLEANSKEELSSKLSEKGWRLTQAQLHETTPRKPLISGSQKVSTKALVEFTRQLASLLKSDVSIAEALDILIKQESSPYLKTIFKSLSNSVYNGDPLSKGLEKYPKVFTPFFINMIKAGEVGGSLESVLLRLPNYYEKTQKMKKKVRAAMIYPTIVLSVSCMVVFLLMLFVVPKFELVFNDMLNGAPLLLLTQYILSICNFLKEHIISILLSLIAMLFILKFFSNQLPWKRLLISLPIVGGIFQKLNFVRFSQTLGTLLTSNVPALNAIEMTRNVLDAHLFDKVMYHLYRRVSEGGSISKSLMQHSIIPPLFARMIAIGEETGTLPEKLDTLAKEYEEEVNSTLSSLTALLEPLMIVFLTIVVGTLIIAMFLPILGIIENFSYL